VLRRAVPSLQQQVLLGDRILLLRRVLRGDMLYSYVLRSGRRMLWDCMFAAGVFLL
jgi:hypothetical protein